MRRWLSLVLLAGCGASVQDGGSGTPDSPGPTPPDAPDVIDAPIDARPCTGGDANMTAPDGSCLLRFAAPITYTNAIALCAANNAHLAILDSQALSDAAIAFVGARDAWIGLDDRTTENTFVWIDGSPLVFRAFAAMEPNNGSGVFQEDCIVIAGESGRPWDDRPCSPADLAGAGEYEALCQF
jgi:hypothetical protein